MEADFSVYLDDLSRLLSSEAECCEMPVTVAEIQWELEACMRIRLPGSHVLPNELHISTRDLLAVLLEKVNRNWQQNGRIPIFWCHRMVTLLRKNQKQGGMTENSPMMMLNAELKILSKLP